MECAANPSKLSSNVSHVVSIFAKVCSFRSIGVNPNLSDNGTTLSGEDSSDATEETLCDAEKVQPHPPVDFPKLFDTVSALKMAYLQFQEAHIPYDPEKIKAADELIVNKLEALCKIKRAYKAKQFKKANPCSTSALLIEEIQVLERLLANLHSQMKSKDSQILLLRLELQNLSLQNPSLFEKFRQNEEKVWDLSFTSFHNTFREVSKAIHDFAKPLISLMRASGWDLDLAANKIEGSVVYSKRSHKKYAFEAYVTRRMFGGISLESDYVVDDIIKSQDPIEALTKYPDSNFAKFCRLKYLLVVHPKMEASFFRNLDQRNFVLGGKHPRTPFYQAFVKMARWVWVLRGIAAIMKPKAEIFGIKRGSKFSDVYMECVEEEMEYEARGDDEGQARFKVEFMVIPGFRIGEKMVRSQVYLSKN
ncbi:protein GRAVITROPIC IN THE LIGHT 1 [Malania oleifera]|uniref:protein GRAVITROPIC IN THE LIGHT 1 n=1 Tax=Malania oleifera TaxID=397392 RepID=UPI0025ADF96F|nr:protein GRAVITROPIC IN THE LIGHT 1 [Malania oleifera]